MPSVKVYTRTTCAPCKMIKHWLQSKDVPYTEINIDETPEIMDQIIARTGVQMVPLIEVGDQFVQGMNFPLLSSLLML